jgi:hypothetical protein
MNSPAQVGRMPDASTRRQTAKQLQEQFLKNELSQQKIAFSAAV